MKPIDTAKQMAFEYIRTQNKEYSPAEFLVAVRHFSAVFADLLEMSPSELLAEAGRSLGSS
ncbi:YdiH family protein [Yersinia sp. LJYL362]|uniref:YdiH family protein n=1 Tax=Yersinia sp. LJYL362 TaxID=3402108 RepID=UPI003AB33F1B